jgi:hypothetical protein
MFEMEVHFQDLKFGSFRFLLRDKFRRKLFEESLAFAGGVAKLSKILKCNRDSVRNMKMGFTKFIHWKFLDKLIAITKVGDKEIERNVTAIKAGKAGKETKVKLPIKTSRQLTILIAKGMGDGTIEKNFRFSFWNKDRELVNEVCKSVNRAVGVTRAKVNTLNDGRIQAKFNPFVGFVLNRFGVPIGDKTLQTFDVPKWIKSGDRSFKASFIRGIFDDEGSVELDVKHRTRRIVIGMGKRAELKNSLETFLNSIKDILLEFDIKSTKIREQERFVDKNGIEKVILQFSITGKNNLEKFFHNVNFTSKPKRLLKRVIRSFKNRNSQH